MRAQKAHEPETGKEVPSEREVSKPQSAPQHSEVPIIKEITNDVNQPPTHLFAKAKDATYSPLTSENVAAKPKPPPVKKPEVTYRTSAPIYDPQVASDIYSRTMNLQITLTQCELLSLSPEVRSQVHEATSNRRVPRVSVQTAPTDQNFVDTIMSIELDDEEGDRAQRDLTQCRPPTNPRFIPQRSTIKLAHTATPSCHRVPLSLKIPMKYFSAPHR